ncbi:hypothetical protein CIL05_15450 [Virgibacillus profundi]|uniref:ABC transporter permease n=1 Tax=Virgibacillus profundi TaxID=2024555 RepID=A0A2A2IC79_9BACI|nr:hypothetical protein [Virgibacillus profundi]PAV28683.1 hypothetical protein CIL05_15450 [Virgibacillus profundi]PXY52851.1 hypothetical protein CIT14_15580 [Virgibacillus profundi]
MYQLIKLEFKKNKIGWYIKGAIIANIIILGMLCLLTVIEKVEGETIFRTFNDFFMISGILIRGTFTVFAAVLISKVIIDEFKNRTSLIMFSYPINRKKIMASKLLLIFSLTLVTMFFSTIIIIISFTGLNQFFHLTSILDLPNNYFVSEIISLMMFNLMAAGASLVPLYFGMIKFSTPATIISSLIIVMVTSSSIGSDFSLANIFYIPLALSIVAVIIILLSIRNINHIELG